MTQEEKTQIEERIVDVLKTVYDPEIPVNIYDLGLSYKIDVKDDVAPNVPLDFLNESAFIHCSGKVHETAAVTQSRFNDVRRDRQVNDFLLVSIKDSWCFTAFSKSTITTFSDRFAIFDRQC